ncbi:hypothetical protein Vadar_004434 [Vaccinium darrowii]|uniref:Uncharacterized protein n=1 Tax=Vaccinium darrowii TaxID=229202 RepID=A0ACB7YCS8_9ERIC|nr:hypothetical protein Vadar_004434 [Vaccinium darrowii]
MNILHCDSLISSSLKIVSIPTSYGNPEEGNEVEKETETYSQLSSLTSLIVENIQGLKCPPSWFFQGLTGLQELSLSGCQELTSLWNSESRRHDRLLALRRLVIKRCPLLISLFKDEKEEEGGLELHEELPYTMMLEYLKIEDCKKLEKLPRGLHNLKFLQELIINTCPCLISFPKTGFPPMLKTLRIDKCIAL